MSSANPQHGTSINDTDTGRGKTLNFNTAQLIQSELDIDTLKWTPCMMVTDTSPTLENLTECYKSDFYNHIDCDSLDTRRNDDDHSCPDNLDTRCDDATRFNRCDKHDNRCNENINAVSECDKPDIGCTSENNLSMRDNPDTGCGAFSHSCESDNNEIACPDSADDANLGESCMPIKACDVDDTDWADDTDMPEIPVQYCKTVKHCLICLLYTSPSPRDQRGSRMPSSA